VFLVTDVNDMMRARDGGMNYQSVMDYPEIEAKVEEIDSVDLEAIQRLVERLSELGLHAGEGGEFGDMNGVELSDITAAVEE
jgi:hypothetical protein